MTHHEFLARRSKEIRDIAQSLIFLDWKEPISDSIGPIHDGEITVAAYQAFALANQLRILSLRIEDTKPLNY